MGKLTVEVKALANHATYRYDDSLICDSLRHFVVFAANVPRFAWGTTQWSARWAQDWESAADARMREAQTARDVQSDTGSRLFKVAANYAHTEINTTLAAKALLSRENGFLLPWVEAASGGRPGISVKPGDNPHGPDFSNIPDLPYQPDSPKPGDEVNPNDPRIRIAFAAADRNLGPGGGYAANQGSTTKTPMEKTFENTPGRHALLVFLARNEGAILNAQNIVKSNGAEKGSMPLDDFIADVRHAYPGIIENRAQLFNAISSVYGELSTEMTTQTNGLVSYWDSPGAAAAYVHHANRCIKFFDTLKEQAAWLGSEGVKAGGAIDKLQEAYAEAGNDMVGNLIAKLEAYKDAASGFTSGATQAPLEELANALNAMADAFFAKWKETNANAGAILKVDQVASDNAPNLGDAMHRAQPFASEVGAAPYDDANSWKPNSDVAPPSVTG